MIARIFSFCLLVAGFFLASPLFIPQVPRADTGTPAAPVLNPSGFSSSDLCAVCHADIHATWKNSLHSQASNEPVFKAAFLQAYFERGDEARKTCLACHAPISRHNSDAKLLQPLTRENVNCDFCHSISEAAPDHAGPSYKFEFGLLKQGPRPAGNSSAHKSRLNPLYSQSRFCAGCHELDLPGGVKLLGTFSEWLESAYAAENIHCQNCHMLKVSGRLVSDPSAPAGQISSHDIAGGHSLSKRQESVEVKIAEVSRLKNKLTVAVDITNKGAGHRLPTGLPSKKVSLEVSVRSKSGNVSQTQQQAYQKVLVDSDGKPITNDADLFMGKGVKIQSDNRLAPRETRREQFVFFVPENAVMEVTAAVFYNYSPNVIQPEEIHIKLKESRVRAGP